MIILANAYKTKPRSEGDDENIHQISPDGRRHSIFYQTSAEAACFVRLDMVWMFCSVPAKG